ncbi:MAG: hypothetical protein K9I82_11055 [Chitinophagaceae bacterium]|nr:hypothetical protein [Chitinophagaceae bacterium]
MTIISTILMAAWGIFHPFFVSLIEIEYLPKEQQIGIACKINMEDLESTLEHIAGKSIDIQQADKKMIDGMLQTYFQKHLFININGKNQVIQYLGFEHKQEATLVYLEIIHSPKPKKLVVTTNLMYEYIEQQIHIIQTKIGNQRKSYKLTNPEEKALFNYEL